MQMILDYGKSENNEFVDSETQYQARKTFDQKKEKRYSKRKIWSESESLFMQRENGSSPVGEVKQFVRFKKHRFYEKTAEGCAEISAAEYVEKGGRNLYADFRQANNGINENINSNGSSQKSDNGNSGSYGNNRNASLISKQTVGEGLRNDSGRSLRSIDRNVSGISELEKTSIHFTSVKFESIS